MKSTKQLQGKVTLLTHEPGNATRYELLFVELPKDLNEQLNFAESSTALQVSWINQQGNAGSSMLISNDQFLHFSYVMEKMKCGPADANVIADMCMHFIM